MGRAARERLAFSTVIEIHEDSTWCIHQNVVSAVDNILRGLDDGSYRIDPQNRWEEDSAADTGSTSGSSQPIEVQRCGVSKVPARLMATLTSGGTYMCCFDGSVGSQLHAGAACCFFRIRTDGIRSVHLLDNATISRDSVLLAMCGTEPRWQRGSEG